MNYKVSAASPTCELITVGQILSEVGDCASTVLDREHLSFTRKCATRLKKVVGELIARRCIQSPDDLYEIDRTASVPKDLSSMTVDELYRLYRQWPLRHAKGTDNLEDAIVRELSTRTPTTRTDQLKIDYCLLTHTNESEFRALNS
ncbi:MAG: hypothetical protein J6J93_03940 [Muribaculaceae bacterium]|nr:hypothetical protein [Muribaculaceae bacterium]